MSKSVRPVLASTVAACLLAACASAPPAPPPPSPQAIVASIQAAGRHDDSALRVTPLRDAGTEALVDQAHKDAASGQYPAAAAQLDKALQDEPHAPDILQDRAEIAVRLQHYAHAEQLAQASWNYGPKLGALCARNWQTVLEMRRLARDSAGVASARQHRDACRVKGVVRM
ncbi:tetratricopeptide repeat protein [Oleiagrimonas sp. MCCC 1A03011]|uniref:tetratricopeptide repeat protein n=1 Tax=Oleiagrimonas sp. MCCC 1A03011 TaxID=1926883 RepID=UPI000DC5EDFA|nr:tetratricopeptide repeat protein [Oleiagrimonas sp. MCCC 1A03011]RAP58566.1 hypothetical protein BTJ49_06470 [Oleiagrimonas sp. MCCC 1A03011]